MIFQRLSNPAGGAIVQLLKKQAAALLDQDCALCGAASGIRLLCEPCERSLPRCHERLRFAPRYAEAFAAFDYRFPVDRMIQRFKYRGDLALGRWLALSLAARIDERPAPDLVVAPPLSPARLRERGFDQALEIAKVVAAEISVPVGLRVLSKVRETEAQRSLNARRRRANLRGVFRCHARLEGMRIALVDDVVTTGATAEAVTRALERAGAASVELWAVARTP